jgi:hypothetical protein
MYGEKDLQEIAEEMGQDIVSNDFKLLDNTSQMSRMLNQWKSKTEEKIILNQKLAETMKLENLYYNKPGALINELLKRVKSLEYLLRGLEGEDLHDLHVMVSDLMIKNKK